MKETKRALIASGLSLLVCFALMTGMSFAWFTDAISNKGNTIVAGTLAVDLMMDREKKGTYSSVINSATGIFSDTEGQNGYNWEPGKTEIVYLAVRNNGQLDLKYNIDLDLTGDLTPWLEYALISEAKAESLSNWNDAKQKAGKETGRAAENIKFLQDVTIPAAKADNSPEPMHYFALAVHMKEDAPNGIQGQSADLTLTVHATQVNAVTLPQMPDTAQ